MLASGLEASKQHIKDVIALQQDLVAQHVAAHGPIKPLSYTKVLDYGDDVWDKPQRRHPKLGEAITISQKADRNAATDAVVAETIAALAGTSEAPGEFRRSQQGDQGSGSQPHEEARASVPSTRASGSTVAARQTSGRSRPRSVFSPRPTAPACSSGARPRCSV